MSENHSESVTVALCADRNVLPGLHVTLFTALTHLADVRTLNIHLFSDSLTSDDYRTLAMTLKRTNRSFTLQLHPADVSNFRSLPWQGGWLTYFRLIVAEFLSESRFVYLDADLIILCDLGELQNLQMEGYALGAASWGPIRLSNDQKFFRSLGYDLNSPYFNAGVLLINRDQWVSNNVTEKCLSVAHEFGRTLSSMDQTILNVVFYKNFLCMPRRFNTPVSASRAPLKAFDCHNRIIHLVAWPKPWDAFGFLNGQYHLFRQWVTRTCWDGPTPSIWSWRYIRKSRAIVKCLPNLLRNRSKFHSETKGHVL